MHSTPKHAHLWNRIYQIIRGAFAAAVLLAVALVLSVVLGGTLWAWLLGMALLAGAGVWLWRRYAAQHAISQPSETQLPADIADPSAENRATAARALATPLPNTPATRTGNALNKAIGGFIHNLDHANENTPWAMPAYQVLFLAAFAVAAFTALALRFYQLQTLQAEVYGDINIVHEYLNDIRAGGTPTYFALSAGPLYHYLIYPFIQFAGQSYSTIKLASVIVSMLSLACTYLLCRRLINDWFAVIATFIAACGSWLLVFSRLGNSQILLPLLTSLSMWLLLRFLQTRSRTSLVFCGVFCALGLYGYPQSFVMPLAIGLVLLIKRVTLREFAWFVGACVLTAIPFIPIFLQDPANFTSGYIGSKIVGNPNPIGALLSNIASALLGFHVKGDIGFRGSAANAPFLDFVSGLFFIAGMVFWFWRKPQPQVRTAASGLLLLVPFLVLQLPSILVLNNPQEVPSASRALAVAPIAYIFVASGVWWMLSALRRVRGTTAALLAGAGALCLIFALNIQRYFNDYLNGLPYQNTAIAQHITDYVNTLPQDTPVYLMGCCWESGQPEPKGVQFEIKHAERWHHIEAFQTLTCEELQTYPAGSVIIWSFKEFLPVPALVACANYLPAQMHTSQNGLPLFNVATLQTGITPRAMQLPKLPPLPQNTTGDGRQLSLGLQAGTVTLDGQIVNVLYSAADIGQLSDAFDGDPNTLMRGATDNPYVIELSFESPKIIGGVALQLGSMPQASLKATFTRPDGTIHETTLDSDKLPPDPTVELKIPEGAQTIVSVRIEIFDRRIPPQDGFHTHVRDIKLMP